MLEISASDIHGRITSYELSRGSVLTPTLVPVVDPKDNIIEPKEILKEFNFNFIITSSYLFLKRYGIPKSNQDIHELLDFPGNIMMDSGAYQILAYGDADIQPLEALEIQTSLAADIGVILDVPTPITDTYKIAKGKVDQTIERIKISLNHIKKHPETIWTLPIQGGKHLSLIEYYIEKIEKRDYLNKFGFYALGSIVPIMSNYDYETVFSMIYTARKNLPHHTPLHIFGAGHPMIFPFIVALGADTFDSAAYVLFAKDGRYMTPHGTNKLSEMTELPCICDVCNKWTAKELRKTGKTERIQNLALHNLAISKKELKKIREAIREERLWEMLERRAYSHPELYKAFKEIQKFDSKFFEVGTSSTKSGGLKIYGADSFHRPEFSQVRKKIFEYTSKKKNLIILPVSGFKSPIESFSMYNELKKTLEKKLEKSDITIFLPFLGLIPFELVETFPFSQFVFSSIHSSELLQLSFNHCKEFIQKQKYKNVVVWTKMIKDKEKEYKEKIIKRFEKIKTENNIIIT